MTSHALPERIGRHVAQSRRNRPIRPGGLMEAIRRAAAAGVAFRDAFRSRILARATSLDQARLLERSWIEKLSCRAPSGLNLMPGGSSVGGPANAMPCRLELADGGARLYASLRLAIADGNRHLAIAGRPALQARTVYARLAQGWTLAQALGQAHRPDARGLRPPFVLHGVTYDNLREAAGASGPRPDALRSRLHRMRGRQDGAADVGVDRRLCGKAVTRLLIPWPGGGDPLTAGAFATRTGVPKATVIHRWHRIRRLSEADFKELPVALLHRYLTTGVDRRKVLVIVLDDNRTFTGGHRDLIRRVLADPDIEAGRVVRLSASGIRRRLRVMAALGREDAEAMGWAFGFFRDASGPA